MIQIASKKILNQYLERDRIEAYLGLVEQANRKFNLVSRHADRKTLELLVAESLIPLEQGWISSNSGAILDIGSGWGIPAIPLLLSGLGFNITMVERSQKKADFLFLLLHRLGLKAEIISGDLNSCKTQAFYSPITLRGVALNQKLVRSLKKLSGPEGQLIYFGGGPVEKSLVCLESLEYSIDNLPARQIIKYSIH